MVRDEYSDVRMSAQDRRVSINVRIDPEKFALMEQKRETGVGFAKTTRNRSDIANELIGLGLNISNLQEELGARDFEKVWTIIMNTDWKKFNLDQLQKFAK